jgi:hypothetical protein
MPQDALLTPDTAKVCCTATIRSYLRWREESLGTDNRQPADTDRVALHCADCHQSCVYSGGVWRGTI